ncbi:hypothetical protein CCMSSC00406_0003732 [Pleurotus cornucopiae]|uniref:Uncharacterized protein n=1 Tax=Pleurotus cornucopiae TaxID=5321 RepID=A0ACB7ISZ1_PLECO|nr:hypothetical protein CCMSSC00406_0003732 [Pleurotus cornucopiae]
MTGTNNSSGKTRRLSPDERPTFIDTWKDMEKLLATGKVKTIGVSNFSVKTLSELLPRCTVIPAINQVQLHPCLPQVELKAFCEEKGILLTAYTHLGRAESKVLLEHETIVDISKSLGVTPAQVLLSWSVQRNIVVIPKSEKTTSECKLTSANDAHDRVRESFEESLQNLQCGYVDLYLMHWPFAVITDSSGQSRTLRPDEHPTFIDTWKEMEKLLDTGKVKTIGVSNFSVKTLTELLPHCTVIPATNQVELHPCLPQAELKVFCEEKGILLTAYTPLGRSKVLLEHETVGDIAKSLSVTPAQVLLSWSVQRGIIVVPKSEDDQRMQDNIKLVHLSDEAVERINKIHEEPGMHRSLLKYHSPEGGAFGWSYEDFGWNMVTGGIIPSK